MKAIWYMRAGGGQGTGNLKYNTPEEFKVNQINLKRIKEF